MKTPLLVLAACGVTALLLPHGLLAAKADGVRPKTLAKYDTNHNGKLDVDEYAAVRTEFAKSPKGELAKLDTNHDGTLSDDELAAAMNGARKGKSDADKTEKKAKRGNRNSSSTPSATTPPADTPTPAETK